MPYNFVADSFHTKKLCSRLSSSEVRLYTENGGFAFLSLWGLGETYDVYLRLIGKYVVDFLLVLIELLLGVTAEALRANIDWKSAISLQRGQFVPKFQVEGMPPPPILLVTKIGYMIFHVV